MKQTPSSETVVEDSITRHTAVSLHWRHCSIRGQIHTKVRRCTHEFPSKLLVTMNQAPSRRTRGQKMPESLKTAAGSLLTTVTIVVQSTVTSG